MISEEQARDQILRTIEALPSRTIPVESAAGCFARSDYFATVPLPVFDNSAMDGYAVVAAEVSPGKRLRVVAEQPAGIDRGLRLNRDEVIRIFTGAPLPAGADAVVMQEDVQVSGADIVINTDVKAGEFIRRRGADLAEGQKIMEPGDKLTATNLALLASQGFAQLTVGGEVTVGIISTGDELVRPGEKLRTGQIYESNSVLLRALVEEAGAVVTSVQHCADDQEALEHAVERGLKNAVLVISGGVSVGEHDLVKDALLSAGVKIDLWRVAIKPGKPFLFGQRADCAVFGLPGNPVSGFVTFLKFVRPAILKMAGANDNALRLQEVTARLGESIVGDGYRPHYVRGRLADGEFKPIGRQESHALFGLSKANALLRVTPGEQLASGTLVTVEIWT